MEYRNYGSNETKYIEDMNEEQKTWGNYVPSPKNNLESYQRF